MDCPVCGFSNIGQGTAGCPRCKTDLSAWLHLKELPDVYYNKAVHLINQEQLNEARQMLITALGLDRKHIDSHILLGKVCAEIGMYDEAIAHWEEALQLGAEDTEAINEDIKRARTLKKSELEEERREEAGFVRTQEQQKLKKRWIVYSAAAALVTLLFGFVLSPLVFKSKPENIAQTPSTQQQQKTTLVVAPKVKAMFQTKEIRGIQIEESNGIIHLSGKVSTLYNRYRLEEMVKGVEGVLSVNTSEIEVVYPEGYYYTVKAGDSLWLIAKHHLGNGALYGKIYQVNKAVIPASLRISPGQKLLIPK